MAIAISTLSNGRYSPDPYLNIGPCKMDFCGGTDNGIPRRSHSSWDVRSTSPCWFRNHKQGKTYAHCLLNRAEHMGFEIPFLLPIHKDPYNRNSRLISASPGLHPNSQAVHIKRQQWYLTEGMMIPGQPIHICRFHLWKTLTCSFLFPRWFLPFGQISYRL